MIIVDSSVWVDWFNGRSTAGTEAFDRLLGHEELAIGDLILIEVLQGCRSDVEYATVRSHLKDFPVFDLVGTDQAVRSAELFRALRRRGVTARKTIDTIIATRCIVSGYELLHSDRDFDPFALHLGLKCVVCET